MEIDEKISNGVQIPEFVKNILKTIEAAGFEAFVVGGCVRDLLMGKEPKDWDTTTNAKPEQIMELFENAKYENVFGTVIVPIKNEAGETEHVIEVTTYRSEEGYTDRRRPDKVVFEDKLENDLSRRDFTMNAIALRVTPDNGYEIIDLFGGQKDIVKKVIRAVGEPSDRFREDALRMMRAIRFSAQLGFEIEPKTKRAIVKMAGGLKFIANERIKDELLKIMESNRPYEGVMLLHETKLLQYIIPELERGVGVKQSKHHIYTVFQHLVYSLKHCPSKDWRVRMGCLLHDVGKPQTHKIINGEVTFYNHEYVGAKLTKKILTRLRFSNEDIDRITNLVRNHMFYYNVGEVTPSAVRRLLVKVGKENIEDLIAIRIGDRLGSGVAKAKPYKLRHLEYMVEKVSQDPISAKMLKINGDDLMKLLSIEPGPMIGAILDVLLSEVIEEPEHNTAEHLQNRARVLAKLELAVLREKAKEVIEEKKEEEDKELKKEFWVK